MAVADTAYSILDNPSSQGGGGGDAEIISSDNSISIETTPNGEKDLKVNLENLPLVTEEKNGIARSFDKLVNDHSLHNVAYMRNGETAEDNETALTDTDSMYTPKIGQMLNWIDAQGKQHISRYVKMEAFNPLPKNLPWSNSTYDEVHGTFIVLSLSDEFGEANGNLTVAVRSFYNKWQLIETGHWNETWKYIAAGGGHVVALSGNRSREFAVSNDGGYTWELMTLPDDLYWTKVKYMNGKFYFFSISQTVSYVNYWGKVVSTSDFTTFTEERTGDGTQYTIDMYINEIGDVCELLWKTGNNYYLKNALSETLLATYTNDVYRITDLDVVGDCAIAFDSQGGPQAGYTCMIRISDIWDVSPNVLSATVQMRAWKTAMLRDTAEGLMIFKISKSTDSLTLYAPTYTVEMFDSPYTVQTITPNTPTWNYDVPRWGAIFGKYALITTGNFANGYRTLSGERAALLDLEALEWVEPFEYWEELPQIPEDSKGLLCCENKVVENATVEEPYLKYKNKTISANASDRTTEYANYRLTRGDDEIWCIAERNNIIDNTTNVYSDEDCTDAIGVITAHNYNINNPTDTEVSIGGNTYVYEFHDSKIPQSLATTKALIDAAKPLNITDDNSTTPVDTDKVLYQHQGESGNVNFVRTTLARFWEWIKGKADNVYMPINGGKSGFRSIQIPGSDYPYLLVIADVTGVYDGTIRNKQYGMQGLIFMQRDGNTYYNNLVGRITATASYSDSFVRLYTDIAQGNGNIVKPCIIKKEGRWLLCLSAWGNNGIYGAVSILFFGRAYELDEPFTRIRVNGTWTKYYDNEEDIEYIRQAERYPLWASFGGTSSQVVAGDGSLLSYPASPLNNGGEMTQQAYNNMGSHDPNTIYVITD